MKRFLFPFIFVFFIGLFVIPQINSTAAVNIRCADGSLGLADGALCTVTTGFLCCSKSCPWGRFPYPPGAGRCEASAVGRTSGGDNSSAQRQPEPPAPPCAPGALKDGKCTSVVTAFGTVKVEPGAFIARLFGILLAASGGIAVILIIRAGYQIMTARGNPEGIKEGREKIVAAIVGLMFLVFSFVILEVIGVDLLQLPASSGGGRTVERLEASCSTLGGVCVPRGACTPGDGRIDGIRGCNTGTVCCAQN